MRVSQGGQDVATEKRVARFPRALPNLQTALRELPHVLIFDKDDQRTPLRPVAVFQNGQRVSLHPPMPKWLKPLAPSLQDARAESLGR